MANFQNSELQYRDYNDNNFNDLPRGTSTVVKDDFDSELEFDVDQIKSYADTSAAEVRSGKDIQGFPWKLMNYSRDQYREIRLKEYSNFENLVFSREIIEKESKEVDKGHNFYEFQFNTRRFRSTIAHFQLRNLVAATSKHDVYFIQNQYVMHWSSLCRRSKEVLNVAKPIVPTIKYPGPFEQTLPRIQITTMAVQDNLLVAGGFRGELLCKNLNQPGVAFAATITACEDTIINAVDMYRSPEGSMRINTANNDAQVKVFDASSFACLSHFTYPWPVNNTSVSPDGRLLAVLGDSSECLLADAKSGKEVSNLKGHLDYSFASAWHPNGTILATGNQDTTCRLWDLRNLSASLAVLKGRMGAIRSVKFTSNGRFLAMAEAADFVHIFDTRSDYAMCQEIDLFGDVSGISFSPDAEALFIGVADRQFGGLTEFNLKRYDHYLCW